MSKNVGDELEKETTTLYRALGARVEHNIQIAGNQIDVLVTEQTSSGSTIKSAVECKAHSRPVGVDVVNNFGVISNLLKGKGLIDKAVIVSANGFTAQARSSASEHNIELIELSDLQQRLHNHQERVKQAEAETPRKNTGSSKERLSSHLSQVYTAFDNEMQRLKAHQNPNGISLSNLARIAIEEEGDFEVAIEAFMSLIRLSTAAMGESNILSINYPVPTATPVQAAVEVLCRMQKDFSLFQKTIHKIRIPALIGDSPFSSLSDYSLIPDKSFEVITTVLYDFGRTSNYPITDWAAHSIVEQLSDLLLGVAFVIAKRGTELPEPSARRYIDLQGERCVGEEQSQDLLPFVRLSSKIASLPQGLFEHVLSRPNYRIAIRQVDVDSVEGLEEVEAVDTIKRWAVIPFYALTLPLKVIDDSLKEKCVGIIRQTNELGSQIGKRIHEYLLADRRILFKGKLPSQPSQ